MQYVGFAGIQWNCSLFEFILFSPLNLQSVPSVASTTVTGPVSTATQSLKEGKRAMISGGDFSAWR